MAAKCGMITRNAQKIADDPAFAARIQQSSEARAECTAKACEHGLPKWQPRHIPIILHDIVSPNDESLNWRRIDKQIAVLNDICNPSQTPDNVPLDFRDRFSSLDIAFGLAKDDVITRFTDVSVYEAYDPTIMSDWGGGAVYRPAEFMNVYVCNLPPELLGYAAYPFDGADFPGEDAIVVNRNAFGLEGDLYNGSELGKTLAHEVGHYLGLPHIWGESDGDKTPHSCDDGDRVADTPDQYGPNYEDATHPHRSKDCPGSTEPDMFMNYMDVGPDKQLLMFTTGQVAWMHQQMREYRPWLGAV